MQTARCARKPAVNWNELQGVRVVFVPGIESHEPGLRDQGQCRETKDGMNRRALQPEQMTNQPQNSNDSEAAVEKADCPRSGRTISPGREHQRSQQQPARRVYNDLAHS